MIKYNLEKANKSDSEFIYKVKVNALGEYITQTWGWDKDFQRKMHEEEMNSEDIYIIQYENSEVGTVGIVKRTNEIIICRLYIIDKFQSKGIGSVIINDIINSNRGKTIRLGVLKVNIRARSLYEKLGFKVIGEENEHFKMIYHKVNV